MKAGNTKIMDRYIFSGFKTDTKPFTRDNDYNISYHGDTGSIRVAVQQNVEVTVNTTGQQAFIDGTNCFDILKDLRKALSENDQAEIGVILERIDDAMNDISKERARVGTSLKEMESSKMILEEMNLGTTELLSNTEDADVVEAVTNLKEMEVAFEAALKSTDLITSLSLAKFM
jgi:flagellar hook-associated protein 3 FlgL